MNRLNLKLASFLGTVCLAAGIGHAPDVAAQTSVGGVDVAQQPLFSATSQPPLNMLVLGKDHKIYYEAYNDASDLDGDGALDIGYKPNTITYYGYFNSNACYTWDGAKFVPAGATANKQCSGQWSGDFLNYLTTSRMDALRRVLYGGWRQTDSTTQTILQGAFFPQDGHSWGKEYQSVARDGYDISRYAPLSIPDTGRYHLFAVTTVTGNGNAYPAYQAPLFRVLKNTDKRVWNWLSIEGPVAGNKCFTSSNSRVDCVVAAGIAPFPGHPTNRGSFTTMEDTYAIPANRFGSGNINTINCQSLACNPYNLQQDWFLSIITGSVRVNSATTRYQFRVDGDDAIDLEMFSGTTSIATAGCYGGRGFGTCGDAEMTQVLTLAANTTYTFKFRHEENDGGEGYRLQWRTCNTSSTATTCNGASSWTVVPSSSTHGLGTTTITTYNLRPPSPAVTRDDYYVRVLSCPSGASNAGVREATCKAYPNGQFKPTGILHDYGEDGRMNFGLITGSQFNNLEGGVLRRNVGNFGEEIDPANGIFRTGVNGIANSISRLRMIGGAYNSGTDNYSNDQNWNWGGGTGSCPSVGDRAINNGECRMWGNPIAEMMYESMRYFAGAGAPTARFNANSGSAGNGEETTMGLEKATWKDPYKTVAQGGGGFLACAKPYQTVISDINPSYDGDLPGSAFAGAITTTSTTPASITGFNAASEGQAIWNAEFGAGSRNIFIGEVAGSTDGAPTAKSASSFGNIRGLAPEEPTKGGTYYAASVARYARNTDLNTAEGPQNLATYSIALASPLPRIDFPWGDGKVTLLPFAKTASGTFGEGARKPTNTIVDFYVEKIVNLPGQPTDVTINAGRPYAVFRINYEDVEQGNDHDMDAIVRYLIIANADGTVTVTLNSEYAAGSADQNMGYVMSGTTQDGVYLDVRDTDSGAGTFMPYDLNTPNPTLPGGCIGVTTGACGQQLPINSTRVFTPTASGSRPSAYFLNDPLWYAAKYGTPNPGGWDLDGDGVPDNYFLVTNPANLRAQLERAFIDILANSQPTASVATSTPRYTPGSTLAYEASYKGDDWSGDLKAYNLRSDGTYAAVTPVWSVSANMPSPTARKVFTSKRRTTSPFQFDGAVPFNRADLVTAGLMADVRGTLDTTLYTNDDLVAFLKGEQSKEQGGTGCTTATCPYRKRGSKLGDILNSTPAVTGVTSLGYGTLLSTISPAAASSYAAFVASKRGIYGTNSENPVIYVGANDGMLHAFEGGSGADGGREIFAYMPNAVLKNLNQLAQPGYQHRFYVDGSPTVGDAYLGNWRSVLLSSTGAATLPSGAVGGRSVFALDVTNPRNFVAGNVMWEFGDRDDGRMGQFVGRPYMGIDGAGRWIAVFGNGLNSTGRTAAEAQRAVLFIRNLQTGAEIATIDTGVGCASTASGCTTGPNGLATAVPVDNNGDGAADTIYAGDYLGNLWRFELNGSTWSLGNGGQPIFRATDPTGKRQSITSGVYTVANRLGGTMVIFGTGRYLNVDDADATRLGQGTRASVETIYGVWDTRMWNPVTNNWVSDLYFAAPRSAGTYVDLVQQTMTSYNAAGERQATRWPVDFRAPDFPAGKLGWYLDLTCAGCAQSMAGERITATPDGILSNVLFNTFRPEGDSCQPGSQNATMVLDALTGSADYRPIPPPGGWPVGSEPPAGLIGIDTVRGPPPGEPPIVVIRPPLPAVPCLPGSEGCTECVPGTPGCAECTEGDTRPQCTSPEVKSCSWRSPNSGDKPAGKLIPCGRISWKQMR
ncbi:pilus assembly protein [Dokdonella sp. MW10]|uniref:pilus assembly protein n=1 Tax=Dokdonella sp. MW10 TaxID=2992926 RepID=UPI003F817E63